MSSIYCEGKYYFKFIHIPKCAGMSIYTWIYDNILLNEDSYVLYHDHPYSHELVHSNFYEQTGNVINNYAYQPFTFTVIRNPWERIFSLFQNLKSSIESQCYFYDYTPLELVHMTQEFQRGFNGDITFKKFLFLLNEIKSSVTKSKWNLMSNQIRWIENGVDLIIRHENLNKEFKTIQNMFNNFTPLSRINAGSINSNKYRNYYCDKSKKLVEKYFEEDIDIFKYTY